MLDELDIGNAFMEMQTLEEVGLRLIYVQHEIPVALKDQPALRSLLTLVFCWQKWPGQFFRFGCLCTSDLSRHPPRLQLIERGKGSELGYLLIGWSVELEMIRLVRSKWSSSFLGIWTWDTRETAGVGTRERNREKSQGKSLKYVSGSDGGVSGISELLATRLHRFLDISAASPTFPFQPGRVPFLGSGEAWPSGYDSFPLYSPLPFSFS